MPELLLGKYFSLLLGEYYFLCYSIIIYIWASLCYCVWVFIYLVGVIVLSGCLHNCCSSVVNTCISVGVCLYLWG